MPPGMEIPDQMKKKLAAQLLASRGQRPKVLR